MKAILKALGGGLAGYVNEPLNFYIYIPLFGLWESYLGGAWVGLAKYITDSPDLLYLCSALGKAILEALGRAWPGMMLVFA